MKDPEVENRRLRRTIADLTLDKLILQEVFRGKFRAPRAAVPAASTSFRRCRSPGAALAARSVGITRREPQGATGQRGRGDAHRRPRRASGAVWPLRLPQDRRAAEGGGPVRRRRLRRADLVARGAGGPGPTAHARTDPGGRRLVPAGCGPSTAIASGPTTSSNSRPNASPSPCPFVSVSTATRAS